MDWESWGMSALAGALAGLVAGYLIAWRNWKQWWIDRDIERLYGVLLGLSRFRAVLDFCEFDPPDKSQEIYLYEPVVRISENARILHDKKFTQLSEKLIKFAEGNLQLGRRIRKAKEESSKQELRAEAEAEVDGLMKEVRDRLDAHPFRMSLHSRCWKWMKSLCSC